MQNRDPRVDFSNLDKVKKSQRNKKPESEEANGSVLSYG
jgi:hypothetical protein